MSADRSPLDRLRRIGVIGAGQMGGGIAHVCALAGLDVAMTDVDEEALQRGRETIDRNLSRQVTRGKIREDEKAAALGRIRHRARLRAIRRLRHGHRGGDRERGGQARNLQEAGPGAESRMR